MNDTQIALLIAARNRITDRRDATANDTNTAEIDALLSEVPSGYDNDVDLLLGRRGAKLPQRVDYHLECTRRGIENVMGAPLTLDDIAEMCLRCDEQASDGPQHEGMWK